MLFLHITTKVEGDAHQKLLSEKGGRSFPYLVFLDPEGAVVGRHEGERDLAQFTATAKWAAAFVQTREKALKGDKSAQADYLIGQIDLGQVDQETTRKRMQELPELTKEQKAALDARLVDFEIEAVAKGVKDKKGMIEAGQKYAEMKKAGKTPMAQETFTRYWSALMEYSESQKDAAGFEEAMNKILERYGASINPNWKKTSADRLKKLKESK